MTNNIIFTKKAISNILILLMLVGCQATPKTPTAEEPAVTYLDMELNLAKSRSYAALKKLDENADDYEKMRINYLLERVAASEYIFIRNEDRHTCKRAVSHLKWKYWRVKKLVSTAEDFIEHVGTRSKMTGNYYLVEVEQNRYDPLNKLLYAELDRLMEHLKIDKTHQMTELIKT